MNYNFTDRVRKVLAMAREESIRLQHDYVGTEHILLGLIREGEGVAAAVLTNFSVDLEQVQERVEESVRRGKATIALGDLPYNRGAKNVIQFAMAEARQLNHSYVGTEHLLLGLLREKKGIAVGLLRRKKEIAAHVLGQLGVSLEDARRETLKLLGSDPGRSAAPPSPSVDEVLHPRGAPLSDVERRQMMTALLRPIALATSRLGGSAPELRSALEQAMRGVFPVEGSG